MIARIGQRPVGMGRAANHEAVLFEHNFDRVTGR